MRSLEISVERGLHNHQSLSLILVLSCRINTLKRFLHVYLYSSLQFNSVEVVLLSVFSQHRRLQPLPLPICILEALSAFALWT